MSLFRLGHGCVQVFEGITEGKVSKIGKGILNIVTGIFTIGSKDSDTDDVDID